LKDWQKSNHEIETRESLPDYEGKFLTVDELLSSISGVGKLCIDEDNSPKITIIDLRTEHHLEDAKRPLIIKTDCPIIYCLLDDLQHDEIRNQIPTNGLVVTVTETGNRDKFAMRYLYKLGYKNIYGLLFGMRGWLKAGYETEIP
jgi:rhodanese-related sulfurtransferase